MINPSQPIKFSFPKKTQARIAQSQTYYTDYDDPNAINSIVDAWVNSGARRTRYLDSGMLADNKFNRWNFGGDLGVKGNKTRQDLQTAGAVIGGTGLGITGAVMGGIKGAELGAFVGAWFTPAGAGIGAVIGGIIGAVSGGLAGGSVGAVAGAGLPTALGGIVATGEGAIYNNVLKPIGKGEWGAAGMNTLIGFGEVMDTPSRITKPLILGGTDQNLIKTAKASGVDLWELNKLQAKINAGTITSHERLKYAGLALKNALGVGTDDGLNNYDYETGVFVLDFLLEVISDPTSWTDLIELPATIMKLASKRTNKESAKLLNVIIKGNNVGATASDIVRNTNREILDNVYMGLGQGLNSVSGIGELDNLLAKVPYPNPKGTYETYLNNVYKLAVIKGLESDKTVTAIRMSRSKQIAETLGLTKKDVKTFNSSVRNVMGTSKPGDVGQLIADQVAGFADKVKADDVVRRVYKDSLITVVEVNGQQTTLRNAFVAEFAEQYKFINKVSDFADFNNNLNKILLKTFLFTNPFGLAAETFIYGFKYAPAGIKFILNKLHKSTAPFTKQDPKFGTYYTARTFNKFEETVKTAEATTEEVRKAKFDESYKTAPRTVLTRTADEPVDTSFPTVEEFMAMVELRNKASYTLSTETELLRGSVVDTLKQTPNAQQLIETKKKYIKLGNDTRLNLTKLLQDAGMSVELTEYLQQIDHTATALEQVQLLETLYPNATLLKVVLPVYEELSNTLVDLDYTRDILVNTPNTKTTRDTMLGLFEDVNTVVAKLPVLIEAHKKIAGVESAVADAEHYLENLQQAFTNTKLLIKNKQFSEVKESLGVLIDTLVKLDTLDIVFDFKPVTVTEVLGDRSKEIRQAFLQQALITDTIDDLIKENTSEVFNYSQAQVTDEMFKEVTAFAEANKAPTETQYIRTEIVAEPQLLAFLTDDNLKILGITKQDLIEDLESQEKVIKSKIADKINATKHGGNDHAPGVAGKTSLYMFFYNRLKAKGLSEDAIFDTLTGYINIPGTLTEDPVVQLQKFFVAQLDIAKQRTPFDKPAIIPGTSMYEINQGAEVEYKYQVAIYSERQVVAQEAVRAGEVAVLKFNNYKYIIARYSSPKLQQLFGAILGTHYATEFTGNKVSKDTYNKLRVISETVEQYLKDPDSLATRLAILGFDEDDIKSYVPIMIQGFADMFNMAYSHKYAVDFFNGLRKIFVDNTPLFENSASALSNKQFMSVPVVDAKHTTEEVLQQIDLIADQAVEQVNKNLDMTTTSSALNLEWIMRKFDSVGGKAHPRTKDEKAIQQRVRRLLRKEYPDVTEGAHDAVYDCVVMRAVAERLTPDEVDTNKYYVTYIDFEATGIPKAHYSPDITQLGALNANTGEKHNIQFFTKEPMSDEVLAIQKLTREEFDKRNNNARNNKALKTFIQILYDAVHNADGKPVKIVAYNGAGYDFPVFKKYLQKHVDEVKDLFRNDLNVLQEVLLYYGLSKDLQLTGSVWFDPLPAIKSKTGTQKLTDEQSDLLKAQVTNYLQKLSALKINTTFQFSNYNTMQVVAKAVDYATGLLEGVPDTGKTMIRTAVETSDQNTTSVLRELVSEFKDENSDGFNSITILNEMLATKPIYKPGIKERFGNIQQALGELNTVSRGTLAVKPVKPENYLISLKYDNIDISLQPIRFDMTKPAEVNPDLVEFQKPNYNKQVVPNVDLPELELTNEEFKDAFGVQPKVPHAIFVLNSESLAKQVASFDVPRESVKTSPQVRFDFQKKTTQAFRDFFVKYKTLNPRQQKILLSRSVQTSKEEFKHLGSWVTGLIISAVQLIDSGLPWTEFQTKRILDVETQLEKLNKELEARSKLPEILPELIEFDSQIADKTKEVEALREVNKGLRSSQEHLPTAELIKYIKDEIKYHETEIKNVTNETSGYDELKGHDNNYELLVHDYSVQELRDLLRETEKKFENETQYVALRNTINTNAKTAHELDETIKKLNLDKTTLLKTHRYPVVIQTDIFTTQYNLSKLKSQLASGASDPVQTLVDYVVCNAGGLLEISMEDVSDLELKTLNKVLKPYEIIAHYEPVDGVLYFALGKNAKLKLNIANEILLNKEKIPRALVKVPSWIDSHVEAVKRMLRYKDELPEDVVQSYIEALQDLSDRNSGVTNSLPMHMLTDAEKILPVELQRLIITEESTSFSANYKALSAVYTGSNFSLLVKKDILLRNKTLPVGNSLDSMLADFHSQALFASYKQAHIDVLFENTPYKVTNLGTRTQIYIYATNHPELVFVHATAKSTLAIVDLVTVKHFTDAEFESLRLIPYDLYLDMYQELNNNRPKNKGVLKFMSGVLSIYKTISLFNITTWINNIVDGFAKNAIQLGSGYIATVGDYVTATKTFMAFKELQQQFKNMTGAEIRSFFDSTQGKSGFVTKEMYFQILTFLDNELILGQAADGFITTTNKKEQKILYYQRQELYKQYVAETELKNSTKAVDEPELVPWEFRNWNEAYEKEAHRQGLSVQKLETFNYDVSPKTIWKAVQNVMLSPMKNIELTHRLMLFISEIRQGKKMPQVLKAIADTHFDYSNKSGFERKMEFVFPFFTFAFRDFKYWLNYLIENPRFINYAKDFILPLLNDDEVSAEEMEYSPSYVNMIGNFGMPLTDKYYLKATPSIDNFYRTMTDPVNSIIGQSNPIANQILSLIYNSSSKALRNELWSEYDARYVVGQNQSVGQTVLNSAPMVRNVVNTVKDPRRAMGLVKSYKHWDDTKMYYKTTSYRTNRQIYKIYQGGLWLPTKKPRYMLHLPQPGAQPFSTRYPRG